MLLLAVCAGCGTTKWTDTQRTATEQLLLSDAIDRSVSQLDFRALAGKTVYIDAKPVEKTTDKDYLISALRQHMLASGGILKDRADEADYVLEVRSGAIGTNYHNVIFGIPQTTIPTGVVTAGVPATIPELPLVKKTQQFAVAKVYVFAYNRYTGRPVWQSGAVAGDSQAKDIWVFGAGPFQRGRIYNNSASLRGDPLKIPLSRTKEGVEVSIADEAYFTEPEGSVPPQMAQRPAAPVYQAPAAPFGNPQLGMPGQAMPGQAMPGQALPAGMVPPVQPPAPAPVAPVAPVPVPLPAAAGTATVGGEPLFTIPALKSLPLIDAGPVINTSPNSETLLDKLRH